MQPAVHAARGRRGALPVAAHAAVHPAGPGLLSRACHYRPVRAVAACRSQGAASTTGPGQRGWRAAGAGVVGACAARQQGASLQASTLSFITPCNVAAPLQTYWLLLAISQDLPKDAHVAALRDACEQAALEGHWQLPFKQSRLPAPLSVSPGKRGGSGGLGHTLSPLLLSPSDSFTARSSSRMPLSPDGDSRPMSPDGLGGGLYSSVFMDTGVEGLIYNATPPSDRHEQPPHDLRAVRWGGLKWECHWRVCGGNALLRLLLPLLVAAVSAAATTAAAAGPLWCCGLTFAAATGSAASPGFYEAVASRCMIDGKPTCCWCIWGDMSLTQPCQPSADALARTTFPFLPMPNCRQRVATSPRASQGCLLEGPGRPLLPLRVDVQRVTSLQEELGAGEGVSALLLRSATAGEDGGPGVVLQSEGLDAVGGGSPSPALLFSPPNSPRRRQTTFGATLDFVETLCQASSSLTAFQRRLV